MEERRLVRISKFLSKHLRHTPAALGLVLEPGGWVSVPDLLRGAAAAGMPLTRAELQEVVERNDKQRFALEADTDRIRANQGHSTEVDLQLSPEEPPALLYHGTPAGSVRPILESGLKRMKRHHVHLSPDIPTARRVGARRGQPVILEVDAAGMHAAGHRFCRSQNGVWLTESVPPRYLEVVDSE